MVSSFTSLANSAGVSSITNQTLTININGVVNCLPGSFNETQTSQTTVDLATYFSSANTTDTAATINSAIAAAATSSNQQVNGFLSTSVADSQSNNVSISEHLQNLVSANIESITKNSCMTTSSTIQTGVITVNGSITSDGCNFGQNAQTTLSVNCISQAVASLVAQDNTLSTNIANAAATTDQTNSGADSLVNAIASFFESALVIYVVLILGVLLIGFFLVKFLLGGGKKAPAAATTTTTPDTTTTTTAAPEPQVAPPPNYSTPEPVNYPYNGPGELGALAAGA